MPKLQRLFCLVGCLTLGTTATPLDTWDINFCYVPTATITIPYVGSTTITTTITPCSGPVTVVIETPLPTPVCSPTPVPTGACHTNPFCAPAGFNIDYYANPFAGYDRSLPSSYYITEGLIPKASSLTNQTAYPGNDDPSDLPVVYPDPALPTTPYFSGWTRQTNGGVVVDANNFTVVYQGFYRAPATGTYQLCATSDNVDDVFFGADNALSCFNGQPSAAAQPILVDRTGRYNPRSNCTGVEMVRGGFYPIRQVVANWQGPSVFSFTIQPPGGTATSDFTGDVYPVECGLFL